jgi:hypothetical protein
VLCEGRYTLSERRNTYPPLEPDNNIPSNVKSLFASFSSEKEDLPIFLPS